MQAKRMLSLIWLALLLAGAVRASEPQRWTPAQANEWYARQHWLVGSNYIPANAINQLEMWQADTFDAPRIERELTWAQGIGMNTMRVFLHNLLWQQDPRGFTQRIDTFLQIAARHGIKPLLVLFDSCWDPDPALGAQHAPIPGVHNSGWVQAPGRERLADATRYPELKSYVTGIVGAFAKDERILAWDVWNEPDNEGGGAYPKQRGKEELVARLLPQAFEWARAQHPLQPLTSGLWHGGDWSSASGLNRIEAIQAAQSDVLSFHNYDWPELFEGRIKQLLGYGRPILCTEYMARGNGSTFDGSLPIGKRYNVAMINWGFVDGKTQTRLPWDSWERPYTLQQPPVWHHDVLRSDGTPYRPHEIDLIKMLSAAPKGQVLPLN